MLTKSLKQVVCLVFSTSVLATVMISYHTGFAWEIENAAGGRRVEAINGVFSVTLESRSTLTATDDLRDRVKQFTLIPGFEYMSVTKQIFPRGNKSSFVRQLRTTAVHLSGISLALSGLLYPGFKLLTRALRRRGGAGNGSCRECGYNLFGNTSGVCPECGTPL